MKRLSEIYCELEEIKNREAIRLWRLARRAAAHGCSGDLVDAIRGEGWELYRADPECILNPFNCWKFAFKGV